MHPAALRWCSICVLVFAACSHEPKPSALTTAEEAFDRLRAAVAREVKDPAARSRRARWWTSCSSS